MPTTGLFEYSNARHNENDPRRGFTNSTKSPLFISTERVCNPTEKSTRLFSRIFRSKNVGRFENKPENGETDPTSQPVIRSTSSLDAKNNRSAFAKSAAFFKSTFRSAGRQNKKKLPAFERVTIALTPR